MRTISKQDIQGSWLLDSFNIESPDKSIAPWGEDAHGLLIYTNSGHMSVSINRKLAAKSSVEAENIFDSILFYSGTYSVDSSTITHQVTNASNPARIGKKMLRYAELNNGLLVLCSPQESFGRAILKWRKS